MQYMAVEFEVGVLRILPEVTNPMSATFLLNTPNAQYWGNEMVFDYEKSELLVGSLQSIEAWVETVS